MRRVPILLILGAAALVLAGCGQVFLPTPTPIPLVATATVAPRATATPSGPTPLPAATGTPATAGIAAATATTPGDPDLAALNDRLVERIVVNLLDRMRTGSAGPLLELYFTPEARAVYESTLKPGLEQAHGALIDSTLEGVQRTASGGYQARATLRWADGGSQEIAMTLVPADGLYRITGITLGEVQGTSPTATRAPASAASAATRRPTALAALAGLAGRLVFQVSSGGAIYTIDADGTGLKRLADGLDPAWSPPGGGPARVAFTRWRAPWGVYVIRPDGSGEERVVDGNNLKEVAWSPDGKRLAFTINYSSPGGGEICFFGYCFTLPPFSVGQIWTANLETREFLSLPLDDKAVHAPAWDPKGDRIVYAGDRGLAWIDLSDMSKGRFPGGSAWDTSPAFSPDGTKIAYMSRVHNRWEVFVMNADGSGRAQLTHSDPDLDPAPSSVAPAWSPDGRSIAFLTNRDGPWRIYVMNADGSRPRSMFGAALDKLGLRYEWATERVVSWGKLD